MKFSRETISSYGTTPEHTG